MNRPVLSPCIGVCTINTQGLCEGCFRSLQEIGQWLAYSDAEREFLMDCVLPEREAKA